MTVSRIAVFGDSLTWGQGLPDEQKMSSLVNQMLAGGQATIAMKAHSGAVIGVGINPPFQGFLDDRFREVPLSYPTILQELDSFIDHPETIDLVIVNGGPNDIGFSFILNPLTGREDLKRQIHLHCGESLKTLLQAIRRRCPASKIIAVGQYPILTPKSDLHLLGLFLGRVIANCMFFWTESTIAIQSAVDGLGDAGTATAFVPFPPEHATFADDTWLFGLDGLRPEDPMAEMRREACDLITRNPFKRFLFHRASVGHPDKRGSQEFANAIVAAFQRL